MNEIDIITKLGGSAAVVRWLRERFPAGGVSQSAVSHWRHRGIPAVWRLAISTMAAARGVSLPADFLVPLTGTMPDDSGDHVIMEATE